MAELNLAAARAKVEDLADITERALQAGESLSFNGLGRLKGLIDKWQYGAYGWTSPVSLMMTAAWTKWLDHDQDVCKIWAEDENGRPIAGGYSIRTYDEQVTIRVVCRHAIHEHFCSNNSGMQGTRALEKARSLKRLREGLPIKVLWDALLFVQIMECINQLPALDARLAFQYFFAKGWQAKQSRTQALGRLSNTTPQAHHGFALITDAVAAIADPQFAKTVAMVFVSELVTRIGRHTSYELHGASDRKTGANARSQAPGDFWLTAAGSPVIGAEAKDASKQFGFETLSAVQARHAANPSLQTYYLVTASAVAVDPTTAYDERWQDQLIGMQSLGLQVIIFTLRDLVSLVASIGVEPAVIVRRISSALAETPDLKQNTIDQWANYFT